MPSHLAWRAYRRRLIPLFLAAVLVGAYANHFHNAFEFDDSHTIVDNPNIRSLKNIPRFFVDASLASVLPANRTWRPLVTASFAIDYRIANGLDPFWFQLSTFLAFLVLVWVTFLLFTHLFKEAAGPASSVHLALFGAALFGLHPVCAETVNYINQRAEVYSTLGVAAGLWLYAARPDWRKFGFYLLPVTAALLSKAPALVFPAILFLYAWLIEAESPARSLRASLPSIGLSLLFGILQGAMTPPTFAPGAVSAAAYRLTQPYVALRYFASCLAPVQLSADTDLAPLDRVWAPAALAGFAFLAALIGAAWFCSRRRELRPAAFGLLWFLVALAPTSLFPLAELENDHRKFFAFIGLCVSAAWMLGLAWNRLRRHVPAAVVVTCAMVLLAAMVYGVHARNQVWHDDLSLWRDVTVKSPKNGRGLMNYGNALMRRGDLNGALSAFNRALVYAPEYMFLEVNLGIVNGALHRDQEAQRHFERAVSLTPGDSMPHFYYASWLEGNGRTAEALGQARAALALNSAQPGAAQLLSRLSAAAASEPPRPELRTPEQWLDLSRVLYRQRRYLESIAAAQTAVFLRPEYAEGYNNIGAAYAAQGMWDLAIQADLQAVRLKPGYQLARNNLAWALEQRRSNGR